MIDTAAFIVDFANTLFTIRDTYLEIAFANPGGSQFSKAIYHEEITPEKIKDYGKRYENVSYLAACKRSQMQITPLQITKRAATNQCIEQKNILSFDFDAKELFPNYTALSSEQQRGLIRNRCQEILRHVKTHKLPLWFINLSGNGLHLCFKLQTPLICDNDYKERYINVLEHLSSLLEIPLDRACSNPARLFRLPLSTNYKDPQKPGPCQILFYKDQYADTYIAKFFRKMPSPDKRHFHGKQQILDKLSLEKVLDYFEYKDFGSIKDNGRSLVLSSPFKRDTNPSFMYEKSRKIFYDFSLGEGGDLFTLIALFAKLHIKDDFRTVIQYARKIAGILDELKEVKEGHYELKESGVWMHASEQDGKKEGYWICSYIEILAYSRDIHNEAWGRLLVIRDKDGITKTYAMPMEMLAGDGLELRKKLLNIGVQLSYGKTARSHLIHYITHQKPSKTIRTVDRLGYTGKSYVLPEQVFSCGEQEDVVLYQPSLYKHFQSKGTLIEWQENVARYSQGNSLLLLALCAAFCPPLLYLSGDENFGFHIVGPSSIGKTITLDVAGSVWGGGGINGYKTRWRSTVNGLEAIAARHNDTLLTLDELSEVSPKSAAAAAYMLANGCGKQRAQVDGTAKEAFEWRLCFLSAGEIDLATHLDSDGQRIRAGQEVRMANIDADQGKGLGIFEELHEFDSSALLADHLRLQVACYHGTAIRAFIQALLESPQASQAIKNYREAFISSHKLGQAGGQKHRILKRFALLYAAGVLASDFKILPSSKPEIHQSLTKLFATWLDRHGCEYIEEEQILSQIRQYLQTYGSSRFPDLEDARQCEQPIAHCAGFKRKNKEGEYEWLILSEVFKNEICRGFDFRQIVKLLKRRSILLVCGDGRGTIPIRVLSLGQIRCFVLTNKIFQPSELQHVATPAATPAATPSKNLTVCN